MTLDLTVVVLTLNEELNLPSCLESVAPLDCDVFVVDSGSTDRATEIAKALSHYRVVDDDGKEYEVDPGCIYGQVTASRVATG